MEGSTASVVVFLGILLGTGMVYGWENVSTGYIVLLFVLFVPVWVGMGMLWDWKKWRNRK